jgi:type I restriction enzyme S subunit
MKDSGVEWIGEIPEGWEVKRLRNVFSFSKGLTITKENLQDEGIPCINYGEIHSKYGFEVNPEVHPLKCVSEEYLKDNSNSLLKRGDFIFADTSEDLEGSGNFTHLNFEGTVFAGYHTIIGRPKSSINSRFLAYVLHSLPFRNQVRTRMKGVKVFSITQSILKDLTCWYPDEKEQKTIAKYLDIEAAKIDKAIKLQEQQIEKLKELKSTLIDSAVTGKLRVPSVQEIKVS